MTYNEVINRMGALGDALQLPLPAKAMSATLLMRTHYAKGIKEWQTICEQLHKDIPQKDDESEDDYMARINEVATEKSKEETTLAATRRRCLSRSVERLPTRVRCRARYTSVSTTKASPRPQRCRHGCGLSILPQIWCRRSDQEVF